MRWTGGATMRARRRGTASAGALLAAGVAVVLAACAGGATIDTPEPTGAPATDAPATDTPRATDTPASAVDGPARSPTSDTDDAPSDGDVRVVGVTDGDTLDVRVGGAVEKVRLIGINAPESGECFAGEATAALEELVGAGDISLVRDVSERDRFGRLLRRVLVDGEDAGERLVAGGYALARAYPPDTARAEAYAAAQQAAQAAGAGMWGADGCASDRGDVEVSLRVEADAPGDDNTNLNGEWLEISNDGDEPLDLSGWTVKDESATHRYTFDRGTVVPAREVLVLHTGCGEDRAGVRYWCRTTSAVWNNGGDTAFLLDTDGHTVTTHRY